jgi:hypothetical protein
MLEAVNRRGKAIQCRVTCTSCLAATKKFTGVLLMEEWDGARLHNNENKEE